MIEEHAEKREKEENKEEENGAGDLPRSQGILDYAETILAVGQRRHSGENARQSPDGGI